MRAFVPAWFLVSLATASSASAAIPFDPPVHYTSGPGWNVAAADLDGDGRLDAVVSEENLNAVHARRGTLPPGTLGGRQYSTLVPGEFVFAFTRGFALADLNGDGTLDIAAANYGYGSTTVAIGSGTGTFTAPLHYATGAGAYTVAIAQVDGLAGLDLVVPNASANTVTLLLGDGTGSFQVQGSFAVGDWPLDVALADVDGDGTLDIVTANHVSNTVSVLSGGPPGHFSAPQSYAVGTNPWAVVVADFNGDGDPDLATPSGATGNASVLLNDGSGAFLPAVSYPTGSATARDIAVADLDLDGLLDLVLSTGLGGVVVLPGTGAGAFGSPQLVPTGPNQQSVALADLNGDGRPDILNTRTGGLTVALSAPDAPTPVLASLVSAAASPGRVDLVWHLGEAVRATIYRRTAETPWQRLAERAVDGVGQIRFADSDLVPGRYGYRIGLQDAGEEIFAGETWVDVPRFDLALNVSPNPARALPLQVDLTLGVAGTAAVQLLDVSGRSVAAMNLEHLGPGVHRVALGAGVSLAPGVYLVRVDQGGENRLQRIAIVR